MKPGFGLAGATKQADGKASDGPSVRGEDVGQCIQVSAILHAELGWVDEVQGVECQRGRYRLERTVVRTPDLMGRRDMMVTNISLGRLLMKSTLVGGSSGSGSTCPCLLAASS
jgi:hypothetical protein